MKKIELLAERAKITRQIVKSEYYTIKLKQGFIDSVGMPDITETELKENYANNEKLLKKLDVINNALFEADAREYVDVLGNHLSIATARKYLQEFDDDLFLGDGFNDGICTIGEAEAIGSCNNLRAAMYADCIVDDVEVVDKDPLNLKERRKEFRKKMIDWYYALKTAVAVSDATTEVELLC